MLLEEMKADGIDGGVDGQNENEAMDEGHKYEVFLSLKDKVKWFMHCRMTVGCYEKRVRKNVKVAKLKRNILEFHHPRSGG